MSDRATPITVRRPISLKIFGIAIALLALMISVTALNLVSSRQVGTQLTLLTKHFIELDQLVSDLRVETVREVVQIERMLHSNKRVHVPDVQTRAEALFAKAKSGNCTTEAYQSVQEELRVTYPDRSERRIVGFLTGRLCTDLRMKSASELAARAIAFQLEGNRALISDPGLLTSIRDDIANVAQARARLHASFDQYLLHSPGAMSEPMGGKPGTDIETKIAIAQDRIDSNRSEVNRRFRSLSQKIHAGTNDAAAGARALEDRTFWLSVIVTGVACVFGLVFATLITRGLVKPVKELLAVMGDIRRGNLDVHIQIRTEDEIGKLGESFNHMIGGLKEKESIEKMFGRYVDPRVVKRLLQVPRQAIDAGEREVMSVFFSDLEGFTTMCEGLTPSSVVKLLNQYFALMAEPIRQQQGIIDKYIGDSVMAFWGPPFCEASHATLACYAALAQQKQMNKFRELLPEVLGIRRNVPVLKARMGIATGDVTVGSIGSEDSRSFTVIGDTVNLASRLEGANKQYGTQILINEEARRQAGEAIEVREIDSLRVVGKEEPTRVFELLGRKGEISPKLAELREQYEAGLNLFKTRRWEEARTIFERCTAIDAADGPSRLFASRIRALERQPPDATWDGVFVLREK